MKLTKLALAAALAASCLGGSAIAQSSSAYSYYDTEAAPVSVAQKQDYSAVIPASCGCSDAPISDCCDTSCGADVCCDGGCDSACGAAGGGLLAGLFGGIDVGGWASLGYHTYNNALFNQHADRVNLHQAWLYAEKVADGSNGIGLGGRIDYIYGVDAQDTQAFGTGGWDTTWDNGIYGNALPQLYGEVAAGDLSVKVGHFFTLIGYEVVGATGNFFYSHSHTMFNSEPFTHTGALATYAAGDGLTLYGGYVMGWDSGFRDNGDAFLGGYSVDVSDATNITSQYIVGRFGEGAASEVGYMSSFIATTALSDELTHVFWIDYLDTDNGNGRAVERETFDVNNYLLLALSDQVTWGNRLEWYNVEKGVYGVTAGRSDFYAYTTGLNISPVENLILRPELRMDWNIDRVAGPTEVSPRTGVARASQTTFGMDAVLVF